MSWNTREVLANCLGSLAATGAAISSLEVTVVDNASRDGSAEMLHARFPWVRVIANGTNVGFARACNQAIRTSLGAYVLLLNPDTHVEPGAVDTLARFLDEHPGVGAAGARMLNPDRTLQMSCYPAPSLSREVWRLFHLDTLRPYGEYRMADWGVEQPRRVDTLLGACLMLRRAALDQVGLLDERFFIYSEEVDLCTRMRQGGWQVVWVPRAVVVHRGGESTRQAAAAMFLNLYRGKVLYFRKHHGRPIARLYKLVLAMAATARLLAGQAAHLERGTDRGRHLALLGHYWRLLRALPGM